jgi:hypothetical protein
MEPEPSWDRQANEATADTGNREEEDVDRPLGEIAVIAGAYL